MDAKPKKCKECGTFFKLYNSLQKYCSIKCSLKNKIPRIKKVSDKRKLDNVIYSKLRAKFLKENTICPIEGTPTTDVHHKKGRVGSLFLDVKYWIALSREGHKYVEEHPKWAKENGYSLNRLGND